MRRSLQTVTLPLPFRLLVSVVSIAFFVLACQPKHDKVRATLKGAYPVCQDRADLAVIIDYFIIEGRRKVTTGLGPCVLAPSQSFVLIEDRGEDVVKISLSRNAGTRTGDLWTYRVNISDEEPPQKFIALLNSALSEGKGSKEGFIKPETGQLDDCPYVRSSRHEPFHPDDACEKDVRSKGFIRADEYQARFLTRK